MFLCCFADIGTQIVSPPHSSGTKPYSVSSCLTLSIFAPSLSILFIATIIETPAAFAWFIASTVCGIIPSSAATIIIAISVTWAPLALIAVNASCPGVSKKVISLPLISTLYAPICCVIPPASLSLTFVERIASRSDVLPWSTCPITTTTGGLGTKSSSLSSVSSNSISSSDTTSFLCAVTPNSFATKNAVSKSNSLLSVASIP